MVCGIEPRSFQASERSPIFPTDAICLEFGREKSLRERISSRGYWRRNSSPPEPELRIRRTIFSMVQRENPGVLSAKIQRYTSTPLRLLKRCTGQFGSGNPHPRHDDWSVCASHGQWSGHPSYAAQRAPGSSTLPLFCIVFCTELQIPAPAFSHWPAAGPSAKCEYLITYGF